MSTLSLSKCEFKLRYVGFDKLNLITINNKILFQYFIYEEFAQKILFLFQANL